MFQPGLRGPGRTLVVGLAAVTLAAAAAVAVPSDVVVWTRGSAAPDSPHANTRVIATGDYRQIESQGSQILVLTQNGEVQGWDFHSMFVQPKTDLPAGVGFTDIAAGRYHGYALAGGGDIVGWGVDLAGAVSQTPVNDLNNPFVEIAAGEQWGLARRADGTLAAWGDDAFGQVSQLPGGGDFVSVSAGYSHGTALRSDGSVVAWGRGDGPYWEGIEYRSGQNNPPVRPAATMGQSWQAVAAGGYQTYVLSDAGHVDGAGWNGWTQFAHRDPDTPASTVAFQTGNNPSQLNLDIIAVAVGERQGVSLVWDGQSELVHDGQAIRVGTLRAMGFNDFGAHTTPTDGGYWAVASGHQANAALRAIVAQDVPEPAGLSVLAAAGLLLMTRRPTTGSTR